jgi:hypothetical protein
MATNGLIGMNSNFHQGPARELFKRYNYGSLDLAVAHAIVTGVVDRGQVPDELIDHLRRTIEFYETEASPP